MSSLKLIIKKTLQVRIKNKTTRSIQQNRWLWACNTILADHTGFTKEEIHEIIKLKFLKKEKVNEKTGEVFEYLGSSATLTKTEFGEFMESVILWSSEFLKCSLPYPDQQMEIYE